MKAAFLDRDGTINHDYPDARWKGITTPVLFHDTIQALKCLRSKGYEVIIVTNQYIIGEGYITQVEYERFAGNLLETLAREGVAPLDVFYCPHSRADGCACCKPRPDMIHQALERYPAIDMAASFVAGDSDADEGLAQAVGLPFYRVDYTMPGDTLLDVAQRVP